MKTTRFLIVLLMLLSLVGCSKETRTQAHQSGVQVAFDQQSQHAFTVDVRVVLPVTNPANPRSQLKPALYCRSCEKWYPAPPLEVINRTSGAGKCPKTGELLSGDGPLPVATLQFDRGAAE